MNASDGAGTLWVTDLITTLSKAVVVVCHDQVRLHVSQGFRCRDS